MKMVHKMRGKKVEESGLKFWVTRSVEREIIYRDGKGLLPNLCPKEGRVANLSTYWY